jgi:hypothetical protein
MYVLDRFLMVVTSFFLVTCMCWSQVFCWTDFWTYGVMHCTYCFYVLGIFAPCVRVQQSTHGLQVGAIFAEDRQVYDESSGLLALFGFF